MRYYKPITAALVCYALILMAGCRRNDELLVMHNYRAAKVHEGDTELLGVNRANAPYGPYIIMPYADADDGRHDITISMSKEVVVTVHTNILSQKITGLTLSKQEGKSLYVYLDKNLDGVFEALAIQDNDSNAKELYDGKITWTPTDRADKK